MPRSITELTQIFGMRFLVRVPFDVPVHDGVAEDHFRIRQALPTITYLPERGGRVILLTHVGRDPKNSTAPLLPVLKKYFPVNFCAGISEEMVYGTVAHMKEGTALLLENLRAYPGEEANDPEFAQKIATYGDFYVNDAFSVSHRSHASVVALPKLLPNFGGFSFLEEVEKLSKAFTPENPSLFILGGAKFETKAPLINAFLHKYSHTFVGGALANDFLKGRGCEVGTSLVSEADLHDDPLITDDRILLPTDVIAVRGTEKRNALATQVNKDENILDIGPHTLELLAPYISEAKTILWNGPLGNYEGSYGEATKECARLIAESDAYSIVGGGDTIAAIESLGLSDKFGFLSTAGGAMLEFLEKRTLPGIDALTK